jgi:hypothetical protein
VITTATARSNASVPSPSHTLRYGDPNGATASIQWIGANPSRTAVNTWTPMNTSASSDRSR